MQAYTKYFPCTLYSSWEMKLNIRVEVRVDINVDGLTDKWTTGQIKTKNWIPIWRHAKSRCDKTLEEINNINSVCTNCQAAYVMKRKNQYLKIAHAVT